MVSSAGAIVENSSDVSNTELGYLDGVTSSVQTQLNAKVDEVSSTDNAITRFDGTSGSVQDSGVIIDDSNNISGVSSLNVTKLGSGNTVTINQTTNGTALTINKTNSGDALDVDGSILTAITADRALQTSSSSRLEASSVTSTELGYVSGVTSAIQTQLDDKLESVDLTSDVSGILPIANGGTGSSSQNFVDLITAQLVAGVKTFSNLPIFSSGIDVNGVSDFNSNITMSGTGAIKVPEGTEAQRPGTPAEGMLRVNSDLAKFEGYVNGQWGEISGGGGSGINWIENNDIDANDDGYSVFDDAAFPPVDGTGGTTSVTVARNTTTPLRKNGDLLFTKTSGADYTGEGFSVDFTIDNAYQGNMLTGSFLVNASDADCVDEALKLAVYDVTNTQIIRVLGEGISCSDISYPHYFQFAAASNSTSYRLIFTYDNTDTNEVLYYFDEISVGPTRIAKGAPVTDWVTPTTDVVWFDGASTVTPTSGATRYRRVGDSAEIVVNERFQFSSASSNTVQLELPDGLIPKNGQIYEASIALNKNVGTNNEVSVTAEYLSGKIRFRAKNGSSNAYLIWSELIPGTDNYPNVTLTVPIQGWSSNAQMSEDLGNQEIVVEGRGNGGTSLTANVTNIDFTETRDTTNSWDGSIFTAPESGSYTFEGLVRITTNTSLQLQAYKQEVGGSFSFDAVVGERSADDHHPFKYNTYLARGEKISIRSTASVTLNSSENSRIFITKFSSPQSFFKESSPFGFRVSSNAGQSFANNSTIDIQYEDVAFDTTGGWDGTDTYTFTRSAICTVQASVQIEGAFDDQEFAIITVLKNGSSIARHTIEAETATTQVMHPLVSVSDYFVKGDTLKFTFSQSSGATVSANTAAIERNFASMHCTP
jgi:hypothetical protein